MPERSPLASSSESLEAAVARLRACACPSLPVLSGGRLVGILTLENVAELVMVETALRERGTHARGRRPGPVLSSATRS